MIFNGFSKETVDFFTQLKENNNKEWFTRNKKTFEQAVMEPAKTFVIAMGERLRTISPDINANPAVNKSIFRINRDTRFSQDKSPYKTNIGIFFWEGDRPKMECPGFYFHIEPPKLMLGAGLYMIPKHLLEPYRKAVIDPKYGKTLTEALEKISEKEGYIIGGQHYKRVPAGYDPSHPNAELLLHNGLHGGITTEIPEQFYSSELIDYCFQRYNHLAPLHKWLVEMPVDQ